MVKLHEKHSIVVVKQPLSLDKYIIEVLLDHKPVAKTMLQVDQLDTSGNATKGYGLCMDGNLLHFAVEKKMKEHVRILLEHGLVLFHGTGNETNQRF